MIGESECENKSKFIQELILRIKMDDEKFLFGSVSFSHYQNNYFEFYRAQFRGIAIQDQKSSVWRMDSTKYQTLNNTIQVIVSKSGAVQKIKLRAYLKSQLREQLHH